MKHSKLTQVVNWIAERGEGYTLTTRNKDDIILSLDISLSTLQRATKFLRDEGAMRGNIYTGRQRILLHEIAAAIGKEGVHVTNAWYDTQAIALHTTRTVVVRSVLAAIAANLLEERGITATGQFLRTKN